MNAILEGSFAPTMAHSKIGLPWEGHSPDMFPDISDVTNSGDPVITFMSAIVEYYRDIIMYVMLHMTSNIRPGLKT